jgi:hypothetical protein
MRRLLAPALSVLLVAALAACESSSAGMVRASAPDAPARCTHCGWIESKQAIGPDVAPANTAAVYEYTVRMTNGSLRVFREEPSVRWRVGERLILYPSAAD